MVTIVLFALLLLAVGVLFLLLRKFAPGIFNMVWALVFFLCREDLCLESYGKTRLLLVILVVMFNAGYLLGSVNLSFRFGKGPLVPRRQFDEKLLTLLLLAAGAIFLLYAARTALRFGFDLQAIRQYNNSDSETKVFASLIDTILFYGVAMPLMYVGALAMAYNYSQEIPIPKKLLLIGAADLALYLLTAGGRSIFLRIALFFIAAVLWRMHRPGGVSFKKLRWVLLGGAALFVAMELVTAARNSKDISFVQQAVDYIRGAVSHMRYQLEQMEGDNLYFGYVTYGGFLYYPVKLVSRVLGLDWLTSNEIMAFMQEFKYIRVGTDTMYYNALAPNVFYYYFDSGYLGAVVFSLLLGFGAARGERAARRPGFGGFVLWATAVYAIAYSPLDGVLWPFRYPTAIIYCLLLGNFLYKPEMKHETIDQCDRSYL